MRMPQNMKLIVLVVVFRCALSSPENSGGSEELCPAGEEACAGRGKSMMQFSSSHTAMRSQIKDVPEIPDPAILSGHDFAQKKIDMQCKNLINASAVPLDSTGFTTIQNQCCAPLMADFIERLIIQDGNAVCNIGALNGLTSSYECPGDQSFGDLTTDIGPTSPAQSGNCAWIKGSQATNCPVMQASCPQYPQVPSTPSAAGPQPVGPPAPGPSTVSGPSVPSTPAAAGPQPVGPPAPPPTTSAPCNANTATSTTTNAPTTSAALLQYNEYIDGCCSGRNEISGRPCSGKDDCVRKGQDQCDAEPTCVSFELYPSSKSSSPSHTYLSTTCTLQYAQLSGCGHDLYIKPVQTTTTTQTQTTTTTPTTTATTTTTAQGLNYGLYNNWAKGIDGTGYAGITKVYGESWTQESGHYTIGWPIIKLQGTTTDGTYSIHGAGHANLACHAMCQTLTNTNQQSQFFTSFYNEVKKNGYPSGASASGATHCTYANHAVASGGKSWGGAYRAISSCHYSMKSCSCLGTLPTR